MIQKHSSHCVDALRKQCKENAKRPFLARGSNAIRCPSCMMAEFACFCLHRKTARSAIDFILLFHSDEIYKPTNSGRLIADLFPENTTAFLWNRTQPDDELKTLLRERQGKCTVLFPNTETAQKQQRQTRTLPLPTLDNNEKHTFIILDGTWKQASKMFHQSEWLKNTPHLEISSQAQRSFLVRHSGHDMQFATAEVVSLLLDALDNNEQAEHLLHYYQLFNQSCLASRKRGNTKE
ncbi:MAG: tRNA-uridine aminocarboxypropyltransferase [Marinomonas sp.]